jgi:hypothetical protein
MHKASNLKNIASFRYLILFMGIILFACQSSAQKPLTVYLVRHAEKVDHSKDPDRETPLWHALFQLAQ